MDDQPKIIYIYELLFYATCQTLFNAGKLRFKDCGEKINEVIFWSLSHLVTLRDIHISLNKFIELLTHLTCDLSCIIIFSSLANILVM